jgi:hypothetical protein
MTMLLTFFLLTHNLSTTGTSDSLLNDSQSVINYINKLYPNKKDFKISITSNKTIPSVNLKQSTYNSYYNSYYNLTGDDMVEGTCSEIAVALLAKSHKVNQGSYEYLFRTVMNTAMDNGYWTKKYGTFQAKIDSLVTKSFKFWKSNKKGNNDHLSIYTNHVKNINAGSTTIFSCSNHSMHGVGYVEYKIQYTEKILFFIPSTVTQTEMFVIVNDGWFNATSNIDNYQYSYYPVRLISSVTFALTKVV